MGRAPTYSRLASEALWALRGCCTAALAAHALKESPRGSRWGPSAALPAALPPVPHPGTSDAPAGPDLRILERGPQAEPQTPTDDLCFKGTPGPGPRPGQFSRCRSPCLPTASPLGAYGPMSQSTHGPMDPWTHGPMDPWTHGPNYPWAQVPKDPWRAFAAHARRESLRGSL